ncbi:fimbria/pilus periplasmic chaperone [Rahnella sp. PAMC 25559]|uniref:fimbria/pilus periplasmic chaperone n=1 Tax=Rahnella sp. PAMC 25559 TaxID=3423225 RepID=UPI003D672120
MQQNARNIGVKITGEVNVFIRTSAVAMCTTMVLMSSSVASEESAQKIHTETKSFSVKLGATRVIFNPDSAGATLSVINPQDYPILVQSQVYGEDKQSKAPFVVTPPLFRLDGNQQSRIRIVRTGGDFATDRETMKWLCVTGVPPKPDDIWGQDKDGKSLAPKVATLEVQLRINSCVKLLVRPSSLKGEISDVASAVKWKREGNKLKATNPTPFYMNLKEVKVAGRNIEGIDYIPPMGERIFSLPAEVSGPVTWKVITDYGGDSSDYQATLQ